MPNFAKISVISVVLLNNYSEVLKYKSAMETFFSG